MCFSRFGHPIDRTSRPVSRPTLTGHHDRCPPPASRGPKPPELLKGWWVCSLVGPVATTYPPTSSPAKLLKRWCLPGSWSGTSPSVLDRFSPVYVWNSRALIRETAQLIRETVHRIPETVVGVPTRRTVFGVPWSSSGLRGELPKRWWVCGDGPPVRLEPESGRPHDCRHTGPVQGDS